MELGSDFTIAHFAGEMAAQEGHGFLCTNELSNNHASDDERGEICIIIDAVQIVSSSDYPLPTSPMSPYFGTQSTCFTSGGHTQYPVDHPYAIGNTAPDPAETTRGLSMGVGEAGREVCAPRDAFCTLFVEGLPADFTCREASHIFRPFLGYKEVRLVKKQPKHGGGEPRVLCFVDFQTPAYAAAAMDALQGYIIDEHGRASGQLRLKFARYPGARSGGGRPGNF